MIQGLAWPEHSNATEPWRFEADRLEVQPDWHAIAAEGSVELQAGPVQLACDQLNYVLSTYDVYANGHIRWTDGTHRFTGETLHYNLRTGKGRFLNGTFFGPTWQVSSRVIEQISPEVVSAEHASASTCDFFPPHFALNGRRVQVFLPDKAVHARGVSLRVGRVPLLYLPWVETVYRHAPFFAVPGRTKRWGEFVLTGYRTPLPGNQELTLHADWRRFFGWGTGMTYRAEMPRLGQSLLKLYYNEEPNRRRPLSDLPKGAEGDRYRALWRHQWQPLKDTSVVTNIQKYSDREFRRELLFREEFTKDDSENSFVSAITSTPDYTLSALAQKRLNRFAAVNDALPQLTLEVNERPIGKTGFFSDTTIDAASLQRKRAHSGIDDDVVRLDWFQQLSYALSAFRPLEITPRAAIRETFYSKDRQGGSERPTGRRDLVSGQLSTGAQASLKLFKSQPIRTNALGLRIDSLRHVLTPTLDYTYVHEATTPNALLILPTSATPENTLAVELQHKLQTKRPAGSKQGKPRTVELLRSIVRLPYSVKGRGNEAGGRFDDWTLDLESTPWSWLRLETDTVIPSHFPRGARDGWIPTWNADVTLVGGQGALARRAPRPQPFDAHALSVTELLPRGQWLAGLGHRYSQNDKTESVFEWSWRLSDKWQMGTFQRLTWKEVADEAKRFNRMREFQARLQRDLHDWIAGVTYYVDREVGQELFVSMTLKAYPGLPVEIGTSYRPPKEPLGAP